MNVKDILTGKNFYPVFQPIVSLHSGEVYGYEAFSRTEKNVFSGSIERLFQKAEEQSCIWELDKLCRKNAIKMARRLGLKRKLFLNISPASLHEKTFKEGFTQKQLRKYFVETHSIVVEINEHFPSGDEKKLEETVAYYRSQHYRVAVDGAGAAYSGLKRICNIDPEFIKLDMEIIRGIGTDTVKQEMVRSLAEFCTSVGSGLIAKGIETAEELETLLVLGVQYGQGFFLGRPQRLLAKTTPEAYAQILRFRQKRTAAAKTEKQPDVKPAAEIPVKKDKKPDAGAAEIRIQESGDFETEGEIPDGGKSRPVSGLCVPGVTFFPDAKITDALELFRENEKCSLIPVVDAGKTVLGILPRRSLLDSFGSQYGYSLYSRKRAEDMMTTEFLAVDADEPVEQAAALATARSEKTLYDPIVIVSGKKYLGIVTVKDLLDSIVNVEVMDRTKEISRKNRLLRQQQAMNERDLHMAEMVQKSFYPAKAPAGGGWECAFLFQPMASVSGDVYDFYCDDSGQFCGAALFDVSGHGVASGLVGILSKYLAAQAFSGSRKKDLSACLGKFNSALTKAKGMVENYLTGAVIRVNKQAVEYVNAGHTDVLVKNGNAPGKSTVSVLGGENGNFRGSFLGIPDFPEEWKTVRTEAVKGTTLLLYSDCLTESRNLAGDELGTERLKEIFSRSPDGSAQDTLAFLKDIFDAYTEAVPLRDDLTVIVLKYTGTDGGEKRPQ